MARHRRQHARGARYPIEITLARSGSLASVNVMPGLLTFVTFLTFFDAFHDTRD